jgi:energy-coupling factor transporter ATP-binding protein EcfA2
VDGRVLSLLELGTGFNAQLTGRQNIIHSASLLGLPDDYARSRIAQIEAFAEIGEFFDRPLRLYSSGMVVRLAFSMFACFDPDVLIVDEALSVGDVYFQQKCVRRIQELLAGGVTMLSVSHDAAMVQRLCARAMLLSRGIVQFIGPPAECMSRYYGQLVDTVAPRAGAAQSASDSQSAPPVPQEMQDHVRRYSVLGLAHARHGQGGLIVDAATFETGAGPRALSVPLGGVATIRMLLRATRAINSPHAGLHLYDRVNNLVFAGGTRQVGLAPAPMNAGDLRLITFRLTFAVAPGHYTLTLGCAEPSDEGPDLGTIHDRHESIGPIVVTLDAGAPRTFHGMARLPMEVTL